MDGFRGQLADLLLGHAELFQLLCHDFGCFPEVLDAVRLLLKGRDEIARDGNALAAIRLETIRDVP